MINIVSDKHPHISTLPDGIYSVLRYGCLIELDDGRIFEANSGVRHPRCAAKWQTITLINGKIQNENY